MSDRYHAKSDFDDTDAAQWSTSSGGRSASGGFMPVSQSDGEFVYKMNNKSRGTFLLINNRYFQPITKMTERTGTDIDAANLIQRFKSLDFDVQHEHNQTCKQMMDRIQTEGKRDHSDNDCFVCAILSHGDEGVVYGTDGTVKIDDIVEPFKGHKCSSLIGKPKIFIIQACRGNEFDHGVEMADADSDGPSPAPKVYHIPQEADILYAYSTVPGYFSWRNSTAGSWFIQALTSVLEKHGETKDIMWILTRTNHITAFEFESKAREEFKNGKKQVSQIVSMLTKELYFIPKSTTM